jgi:hypothetical protein
MKIEFESALVEPKEFVAVTVQTKEKPISVEIIV